MLQSCTSSATCFQDLTFKYSPTYLDGTLDKLANPMEDGRCKADRCTNHADAIDWHS